VLREDVLEVGQWWHHRLQVVQLVGHQFDGRQRGERTHHAGQSALRSVGVWRADGEVAVRLAWLQWAASGHSVIGEALRPHLLPG